MEELESCYTLNDCPFLNIEKVVTALSSLSSVVSYWAFYVDLVTSVVSDYKYHEFTAQSFFLYFDMLQNISNGYFVIKRLYHATQNESCSKEYESLWQFHCTSEVNTHTCIREE